MLDWMKKLFKEEEDNKGTAVTETEKTVETNVTHQTSHTNYYSNKRENELQASKARLGGNFRFPLIPDDGLEGVEPKSSRLENEVVQQVPVRERRQARQAEVMQEPRRVEHTEVVREKSPVVTRGEKMPSTPVEESKRRPFRPTEVVSPIFGYKRPEREEATPQPKQKEQEDIVISIGGKSVVDAWLEKNGYITNDEPEANISASTQTEAVATPVVDAWLEKNGYVATDEFEPAYEAVHKDNAKEIVSVEEQAQEESKELVEAEEIVSVEEQETEEPKELVEAEEIVSVEEQEIEKLEVLVEIEEIVSAEEQETEELEVLVEAEEIVSVEEQETEEPEVLVEAEEIVSAEEQEIEKLEVLVEIEEIVSVEEQETEEPEVLVEAEEIVSAEEQETEEPEVLVEAEEIISVEEQETEEQGVPVEAEEIVSAEEQETEEPEVLVEAEEIVLVEEQETEESEVFVEAEEIVSVEEQETEEQGVPVEAEEIDSMEEQVHHQIEEQTNELEKNEVLTRPEEKTEQQLNKLDGPKREKKRFVPFNVVMLKQDKRKLEEKRRTELSMQAAYEGKAQEPMQERVQEPVQERVQEPMQEQVQIPAQEETQQFTHRIEPAAKQAEHNIRNVLQTPPTYEFPPITLLNIPERQATDNAEWLEEQKELLNTTFRNFHVGANVVNVTQGPAVTRFEVQPEPGVKVNKITNLSDDIKLNLAARDIRIEAPIPGKNAVGIEVPNKESKAVYLREILRSPVFCKSESPLTVALGLDISGTPIVTDIRKMPHGLIAGSTGSGKSVCINAILTSILYKAKPHEVKLMLIDPKMVELAPYNSVPHLVAPVITDAKAATAALKWAVDEMERRYELFAHAGARDLTRYNTIMNEQEIKGETLPYIVIVVDELADLMMVAPGDVEEAICRIAQKARACGIHLLVATQRPSVDVITGLIKSNIPTRIAFTVSSQVDSRTIIDIGGAEKLLGRGDMLFLDNGTSKPVRVQGVYVSDEEIEKSVAHAKRQMKPNYLFKQEDLLTKAEQHETEDELFYDACQFVVEQGGASTSSLQRRFRIGYNRAARLMEEMEAQGIISEARGTKPRDILITEDEFAAMQDTNV